MSWWKFEKKTLMKIENFYEIFSENIKKFIIKNFHDFRQKILGNFGKKLPGICGNYFTVCLHIEINLIGKGSLPFLFSILISIP